MTTIGKVLNLYSSVKTDESLIRKELKELNLIEGYGIENDKFAQRDLDKTVMIVGNNSYKLALNNNIELKAGNLGENILLDFNPYDYSIGSIFYIDDAEIQITKNCPVCNHLKVFNKKLPSIIKDNRGLYCKILKSGKIKINSLIRISKG